MKGLHGRRKRLLSAERYLDMSEMVGPMIKIPAMSTSKLRILGTPEPTLRIVLCDSLPLSGTLYDTQWGSPCTLTLPCQWTTSTIIIIVSFYVRETTLSGIPSISRTCPRLNNNE
jgi:hypothetical protein